MLGLRVSASVLLPWLLWAKIFVKPAREEWAAAENFGAKNFRERGRPSYRPTVGRAYLPPDGLMAIEVLSTDGLTPIILVLPTDGRLLYLCIPDQQSDGNFPDQQYVSI